MVAEQKLGTRMSAGERRDRLLVEARTLFGAHGFAATRIEDIASAAGVTKPIVYRHFESKEDLYLALLRRHEEDLPKFLAIDVPDGSRQELVAAVLDGWLEYARANSASWLMLFRDHSGGRRIQTARSRVSARAREVLTAFIAERETAISQRSAEPVAAILTSGLAGLILWWIDNPDVPKSVVLEAAVQVSGSILTP